MRAPTWYYFVPRDGFANCDCACRVDGRHYARVDCRKCHGAGVLRTRAYNADIQHPATRTEG